MNATIRDPKSRHRWLVRVLLCASLALGVAGCGTEDEGVSEADTAQQDTSMMADTTDPQDTTVPEDTTVAEDTQVAQDTMVQDTMAQDTMVQDTSGMEDTAQADTTDTSTMVDMTDTDPGDTSTMGSPVGGTCAAATDCEAATSTCWTDGFPDGYCTYSCAAGEMCPAGTVCQAFQDDSAWCLEECTANSDCRDGYICDEYSQCWPGEPACTQNADCGAGAVCDDGRCLVDIGTPPAGTPPATCPDAVSWACTGTATECATVELFEPIIGEGWWNYPLNGETDANQYRSYLRRDTTQMVKYATSMVACVAAGWPAGNGGLLGLGDMSEANGDIPGTSVGSPGHPQNTHTNGFDIDIAYYQAGTADNKLRPVCDHISGGSDQYHCINDPDALDVWRTALFIAYLHDAVVHNTFQARVIGVDGKVGPLIESAIAQLCAAGWYDGYACDYSLLAYEETDGGLGWYYFHHHHLHLSINGLHPDVPPSLAPNRCLQPGCTPVDPVLDPRVGLYGDAPGRLLAPRVLPELP